MKSAYLNKDQFFGSYPEIINKPAEAIENLQLISSSYLYKDIFRFGNIKKPHVLEKLVQALALQIGQEVSCNELSQLIGIDRETIERYIDILEKAFVVFRLSALNRNVRNELKKSRKIYFYDTGIRNAVIKNFNSLALRSDVEHFGKIIWFQNILGLIGTTKISIIPGFGAPVLSKKLITWKKLVVRCVPGNFNGKPARTSDFPPLF